MQRYWWHFCYCTYYNGSLVLVWLKARYHIYSAYICLAFIIMCRERALIVCPLMSDYTALKHHCRHRHRHSHRLRQHTTNAVRLESHLFNIFKENIYFKAELQ
uniref:Uncharacterized protein n=1 Tax=Glossina brevipalpis TaxID=37001 RepID=A0A1A9X3F5_9MUSC